MSQRVATLPSLAIWLQRSNTSTERGNVFTFVGLFVILFVCLFKRLLKNMWTDFHETYSGLGQALR